MPFSFSHRKATQALNFMARKAGGSIYKLQALKLIYFADRYHLRRYGRPIIGDEYLAMEYGPVPSNTKDIAEISEFLGKEERKYAETFIVAKDHTFSSTRDVDERVFSRSDREALEWAWKNFGRVRRFDLVEMTHVYPEWKRHEAALKAKVVSRAPMNYRDFLEDPPKGFEPCHPLTNAERDAVAEGICEVANFERSWR
jgi:uncharacterized phage-associated protein